MTELIVVNGVRGRVNEKGDPELNLEDVARGLGFTQNKNSIEYIRWERVNQYLNEMSFPISGENEFIPENIFYKLCFKADNEVARKFQDVVTDEILPTIRKTGGYVNNDDMFVNTYFPYADENTKQLFKLNLVTIRQLNSKIDTMKPLAEFADHVSNTNGLIDMSKMAKLLCDKGIKVGRNTLFQCLRGKGILMKNNDPYQQYIDAGYFKIKEKVTSTSKKPRIKLTTYVTGKGQIYIEKILRV